MKKLFKIIGVTIIASSVAVVTTTVINKIMKKDEFPSDKLVNDDTETESDVSYIDLTEVTNEKLNTNIDDEVKEPKTENRPTKSRSKKVKEEVKDDKDSK